MAEYPKRESHFAHKFVRLMFRVCAAQEIGADGVMLAALIAHTEDAKRYRSPVTYWNEQLLPVMGLSSWRQLDRIREKCVKAGWLHYERESRRHVGRYWCTIPPDFAGMDDSDISCDASSLVKNDQRTAEEVPNEVPNERRMNGPMNGRMNGESSSLSLPIPNSLSLTPTRNAWKQIPFVADKPDLQDAIAFWLANWPSINGGPQSDEVRIETRLAEAIDAGWSAEKIVRSIRFSVNRCAKRWLDPDDDWSQQPRGRNGKRKLSIEDGR